MTGYVEPWTPGHDPQCNCVECVANYDALFPDVEPTRVMPPRGLEKLSRTERKRRRGEYEERKAMWDAYRDTSDLRRPEVVFDDGRLIQAAMRMAKALAKRYGRGEGDAVDCELVALAALVDARATFMRGEFATPVVSFDALARRFVKYAEQGVEGALCDAIRETDRWRKQNHLSGAMTLTPGAEKPDRVTGKKAEGASTHRWCWGNDCDHGVRVPPRRNRRAQVSCPSAIRNDNVSAYEPAPLDVHLATGNGQLVKRHDGACENGDCDNSPTAHRYLLNSWRIPKDDEEPGPAAARLWFDNLTGDVALYDGNEEPGHSAVEGNDEDSRDLGADAPDGLALGGVELQARREVTLLARIYMEERRAARSGAAWAARRRPKVVEEPRPWPAPRSCNPKREKPTPEGGDGVPSHPDGCPEVRPRPWRTGGR